MYIHSKVRLERKIATLVFLLGSWTFVFTNILAPKLIFPLVTTRPWVESHRCHERALKRVLDFLQEKVHRERAPTSVRFPPNLECKAQHKPSHEGPVPSLKNSPASHVATFFQSTRGGHARYFNRPAVTCTNVWLFPAKRYHLAFLMKIIIWYKIWLEFIAHLSCLLGPIDEYDMTFWQLPKYLPSYFFSVRWCR